MIDNPYPWGYMQLWWVPAYVLVLLACLPIRPRALAPFFALALIGAIRVVFRVVTFQGQPVDYLLGLHGAQAAAQSGLMLFAAAAIFSRPWKPRCKRYTEWALTFICVFAAIQWDTAFFSNPAMASICAVGLLPIAVKRLRVFVLPLVGWTAWGVYQCNEKIGLVLFGVLTLLGLWNLRLRKLSGLAGVGLLAVGLWHLPALRYHWDDRMKTWELMASHAWAHARWLGFGPGATWAGVRYLQQQAFGNVKEVFLMAHNDYLQVFYEMGLAGLAAAGLAWGTVLAQGWKRPELRATLLCWSLAAIVHFPLHDPLAALAVLLTTKLAVDSSAHT